jgi:chaperonin GroES
MKLVPLGNRLIVKRDKTADKTPGGLYLPDDAKDKPQQGKVIAIGEGKRLDNGEIVPITNIKEGNTILFSKYAGHEFKDLDIDENTIIMDADDVLAVLV